MSTIDGKDAGNVARGLKAAAHNPRVSDEAKERVTQRLEEMGTSPDEVGSRSRGARRTDDVEEDNEDASGDVDTESNVETIDGKDAGNVLRGHKAALHNPRVSDEAKANSEKILREYDALDE